MPVWLPMMMLLRTLCPVLSSAATRPVVHRAEDAAAGEHEPVDDGVGRADMQPVAGERVEDGLLRELSRVERVALVARNAGLGAAERERLGDHRGVGGEVPGAELDRVAGDGDLDRTSERRARAAVAGAAVGAAHGDVDGHGLRSGGERDQQCERGEQDASATRPATHAFEHGPTELEHDLHLRPWGTRLCGYGFSDETIPAVCGSQSARPGGRQLAAFWTGWR